MSKTRPVHQWETLDEGDPLAGSWWIVEPEHAGHTMSVVGRIIGSSMLVVACSCGEEYRMAVPNVTRRLEQASRREQ